MAHETSEYELDMPLTMHAGGEPLAVQVRQALTEADDDRLASLRLRLTVDGATYARIDRGALFNLSPDVRQPKADPGFDLSREVQIEAALGDALVAALVEQAGDVDRAVSRLFELSRAGSRDALLDAGSWYALTVTQEEDLPPDLAKLGSLRSGYRTTWAKRARG